MPVHSHQHLQVDKEALDAQVRERREREAREQAEARAAAQQAALLEGCVLGKAAAAAQARREEERRIAAYRQEQEVRGQPCSRLRSAHCNTQGVHFRRRAGSAAWRHLHVAQLAFLFCPLQEERRQREARRQQEEAAARAAEQAAVLSSPWINEAPETTTSSVTASGWRPDHFKVRSHIGDDLRALYAIHIPSHDTLSSSPSSHAPPIPEQGLAPQQRAAIQATVAAQLAEKQAAARLAAAERAAEEARAAAAAAAAARQAAEAEAARRSQAAALAEEQRRQAAEAARREAARNQWHASQTPSPAFFGQFGTSHR